MRHIGQLSDERKARVFGDFLFSQGVRNQVEPDDDGSWSVWIIEEDKVTQAQKWLEQFRAQPEAEEFLGATSAAAKARATEAEDLAAYRQRIRTRRSLFPKFGGHGVGVLTYCLIFICGVMAVYSRLGTNDEFLRHWFISDPDNTSEKFLSEVRNGEVWRLFTPIFIHFGPVHLLFNMMWLFQLGCMIEGRQSTWHLAALVAGTALCSNLAQYYFHHPAFGGMSGVVYGLAGYVWIRGKYDRASGVFLDSRNVTVLLVWLVVCYTGLLGPVANTAHLVGLITGALAGRVSAYFAVRKPS